MFLDHRSEPVGNGQGIATALNFIGGWKVRGNRTAAYLAKAPDPKEITFPADPADGFNLHR